MTRIGGCVALGLLVSGCVQEPAKPAPGTAGGDAARGQALLRDYGCHSCHAVPGGPPPVMPGPSLEGWSSRTYIVGRLHNTPENLARWIEDPAAVKPGTTMPDLGVKPTDAKDLAAHLLTLP